MVNDDQFTPVKLRNETIHEIDKIKNTNPLLRTRPQVITYILNRYIENQNNNGNGGTFSTTNSDPISPPTQKMEKKDQT